MHKQPSVRVFVAWLVTGLLPAQSFASNLEVARDCITAKEWKEAFELLIGLQEKATTDDEREQLAQRLSELGEALHSDAVFADALRAHELALAQWRSVYGDRDHPDVATGLNNVARCLDSLGRAREALPQYEASLAMHKHLYGDRDHPAVAMSLNNVAYCLQSLGRAREALPQYEESLAMRKRLYEDHDHSAVATSLGNVAHCLQSLGRAGEALPQYEASLAMWKGLYGDRDHPAVATSLGNVAYCLDSLGRAGEALPQFEVSLAMRKRLYGDHDHPDVANSLNSVAACLKSLGRAGEALPQFDVSLAMCKRLYGDRDHPYVALSLNSVAACLMSLGRAGEALPQLEASLAMRKRLYGEHDHPDVATSLGSVADCLQSLGRAGEALPQLEASLAMYKRLYGDRNHPDVATSLGNVAYCLDSLGRAGEALPQHEASLAMHKHLYGDRDHPNVATSLNNVAACLRSLGRAGEALAQFEVSLTIRKRLNGDRDHPDVATSLNNVANCLEFLGRAGEALPQFEASLAMNKRLHGDRDHPNVATGLGNVAYCLDSLGRADEVLPQYEAALAMNKRLHGDRDHPDVAASLNNVAGCLKSLGRAGEALPQYEAALAMNTRLHGDHDHPSVAISLSNMAGCMESLGRAGEALLLCCQACDLIERMRDDNRLSTALRQSFFDHLKHGGTFERLQALAADRDTALAMSAAERSRGRDLLDLMEQQRFDPLAEAEQRARRRGDHTTAARLPLLRGDVAAVELESDRLLHLLTRLDEAKIADDERQRQRAALLAESDAVTLRRRQLMDERARLLGDVLPIGRVRSASEIQTVLRDGELLLAFTVTKDVALVYVLAREGALEVHRLPKAHEAVVQLLPALLGRISRSHVAVRGRDPEPAPAGADAAVAARELFASLIPATVWERVRSSKRVLLSAHRELHRLPFELLFTEVKDGKPVHWLDAGPPIAYVPSGTALYWLRHRAPDTADDAASLDLLAVGDPGTAAAAPEFPEHGAFVAAVPLEGQGHRLGLRPHDVVVRYDGKDVMAQRSLGELRMATDAAIAAGTRADGPIPIEVWREGEILRLDAAKGPLGVQIAATNPRLAYEGTLASDVQQQRIARHGDLERIRQLPRLQGAEAEVKAIVAAWTGRDRAATALLGIQATEAVVFDLAAKAKYLHFACHGIAEEYAGQSLSMLVLSQPKDVQPGDDGLLKLGDLLHAWRGRLSSCRLVVLSACRTNVGPTLRDEAPQALPIGFLFAGAPSVISSLWAVDDASTRELMTDFYGRLLAGETDKLMAFTDAKKALRKKYPDPFHWAPFLYMGSPE